MSNRPCSLVRPDFYRVNSSDSTKDEGKKADLTPEQILAELKKVEERIAAKAAVKTD